MVIHTGAVQERFLLTTRMVAGMSGSILSSHCLNVHSTAPSSDHLVVKALDSVSELGCEEHEYESIGYSLSRISYTLMKAYEQDRIITRCITHH